jgi:hypothetical membrane protein
LRALAPKLGTAYATYAESVSVRVGALLWIASTVCFFTAEAIVASAVPGYDYATDYISMLGDPNSSPRAGLMNAAFIAQAIAFPLGAWLVTRGSRLRITLAFLTFATINGLGNLLVASVHSGAGSVIHPIGASLAIAGGNLAALTGPAHRVTSVVLGGVGLLCLVLVALGTPLVGLWERGSVYTIFGWQAYAAVRLLNHRS